MCKVHKLSAGLWNSGNVEDTYVKCRNVEGGMWKVHNLGAGIGGRNVLIVTYKYLA
jgi:hypothetical protein